MSGQNRTRTNLFIDIGIFLAFLLIMMPRLTGISIHEWLALAFAGTIVVHLLFHWEWIVGVAPQFFARLIHESRLNFVIDLFFFLALVMLIVSGFAISKVVLPALGLSLPFSVIWKQVHKTAADAALIALGLHCGMHVKWIAQNGKRHIVAPIAALFKKSAIASESAGGK